MRIHLTDYVGRDIEYLTDLLDGQVATQRSIHKLQWLYQAVLASIIEFAYGSIRVLYVKFLLRKKFRDRAAC